METYVMHSDLHFDEVDYDFIRIYGYVQPHMRSFSRCNILGTCIDKEKIKASNIPGYSTLTDLYAYARSDDPVDRDIVWTPIPMWSEDHQDFLKKYLTESKINRYLPLTYTNGEQIRATTNYISVNTDDNDVQKVSGQDFVVFDELYHSGTGSYWETRIVHSSDPVYVFGADPVRRVDYIFGLTELERRLDRKNLQENSVLVITYRGEKYQTRNYVIQNAIKKGWESQMILQLMDLLATGKVVFAGFDDLYTGPITTGPHAMSVGELAMYEFKAGRNLNIGIQIGEDAAFKAERYMQRTLGVPYRWDENLYPLKQMY